MDRSVVLLSASALLLVAGCAHTSESVAVHDRVVVAVDNPPPVQVDLPPNAFANEEPTLARPRLSRTITLGQGGSEPIYGTPAAPPPGAAAGGNTNVTVNNHVTVVQPPVYYGGYGGYGYGGYGGYGGNRGAGTNAANSTTTRAPDGSTGTMARPGPWAPSGWEGAGRTAAPGATPGVGGNFAPAPSFGPRQMK